MDGYNMTDEQNKYWNIFATTGAIRDYLNYCESCSNGYNIQNESDSTIKLAACTVERCEIDY